MYNSKVNRSALQEHEDASLTSQSALMPQAVLQMLPCLLAVYDFDVRYLMKVNERPRA